MYLGTLSTYILKCLLLLLEFAVDLHEGLLRLVEVILNGLDLLLECPGLFFSLLSNKNVIVTSKQKRHVPMDSSS